MLTPSFGISANSQILPILDLNFLTGTLNSKVTITRATAATYTDSSGNLASASSGTARFDYNPNTLAPLGLMVEESRKNILLNSLLNGTNLSTQSVTTSAVAYTLSFYGTGDITLSGTASATVTGTGAYPSRKTYTFTPTAGTLTLTVSGTVQYAQLEAGSFATSFIATDGTAGGITRDADQVYISGSNFTSFWNTSAMGFDAEYDFYTSSNARYILWGANNARWAYSNAGSGSIVAYDGTNTVTYGSTTAANTVHKVSGTSNSSGTVGALNGGTPGTGSSNGNLTSVPTLIYMGSNSSLFINGHIRRVRFFAQKLTNNETQAFSKY